MLLPSDFKAPKVDEPIDNTVSASPSGSVVLTSGAMTMVLSSLVDTITPFTTGGRLPACTVIAAPASVVGSSDASVNVTQLRRSLEAGLFCF